MRGRHRRGRLAQGLKAGRHPGSCAGRWAWLSRALQPPPWPAERLRATRMTPRWRARGTVVLSVAPKARSRRSLQEGEGLHEHQHRKRPRRFRAEDGARRLSAGTRPSGDRPRPRQRRARGLSRLRRSGGARRGRRGGRARRASVRHGHRHGRGRQQGAGHPRRQRRHSRSSPPSPASTTTRTWSRFPAASWTRRRTAASWTRSSPPTSAAGAMRAASRRSPRSRKRRAKPRAAGARRTAGGQYSTYGHVPCRSIASARYVSRPL